MEEWGHEGSACGHMASHHGHWHRRAFKKCPIEAHRSVSTRPLAKLTIFLTRSLLCKSSVPVCVCQGFPNRGSGIFKEGVLRFLLLFGHTFLIVKYCKFDVKNKVSRNLSSWLNKCCVMKHFLPCSPAHKPLWVQLGHVRTGLKAGHSVLLWREGSTDVLHWRNKLCYWKQVTLGYGRSLE